jgi:branched-chain amino acid transport system permease protein
MQLPVRRAGIGSWQVSKTCGWKIIMALAFNLFLSGLSWSAILFTIASGLSLVFGIMGVINFAHGALYMLGCYLLISAASYLGFWGAVPLSIGILALFGIVLEISLFRPIYKRPTEFQLLLTFGLVIALEDSAKIIWGLTSRSIGIPGPFQGNINLFGKEFPEYYLLVILVGALVAYFIRWSMKNTKFGKIMRATSSNNQMAQAVGINIKALYTGVFALGAGLAAFGGCLAAPLYSAYPELGSTMIITAFIVVVVGRMGSLEGAMLGSLIIGMLQTVLTFLFPRFGTVATFAIASALLIFRPSGLLAEK